MNKLNILVANDDGINAIGIKILANALKKYGNVTVCAPDGGRSATGHSIVLHDTLGFDFVERKDEIDWYVTTGTPADCVRLSVGLIDKKFFLYSHASITNISLLLYPPLPSPII